MHTITPHLWFDRAAIEAAEFYAETFPDSTIIDVTTIPDTPGGDTDIVTFQLWGQLFQAINAGPLFSFNPSVSFAVSCATADEVDRRWTALAEDGTTLMPLDGYPFSERYGWTQDRYGFSWQIVPSTMDEMLQRGTPDQVARVTKAFLAMKKFDLATLERAYAGAATSDAGRA